jgi:hypothetical protein
MVNIALFPLYVFEKDDWSMFLVESADKVLYDIEPHDFDNNEYLFWDAAGRGVRVTIEHGVLTDIQEADNEITIREAFGLYSQTLSASVDTTGSLLEVWARLQANVKPPSRFDQVARNLLGSGCVLTVLAAAVFILMMLVAMVKAIFVH